MSNQLAISNLKYDDKKTKAIIANLIALGIFGIIPILVRWSEIEISPNVISFNRCLIAALILGLSQEVTLVHQRWFKAEPKIKQSLDNKQILLLVVAAVFCFFTQLFWSVSLTQTSVANSALIHSLTPLFTTLGGWLLFNQRFDYKFLTGLAIATIGTIVLGFDDLQIDSVKLQGDLLALLSAVFWSAYLLTVEKMRTQLTVITIMNWVCRIATLLFGVVILLAGDEWFPHSRNCWLTVIALGLTVVVGHGMLAYSIKYLSSSFVAMINLLDPVVAAFLAWLIFAETLSWVNLVDFVVIIIGIYLAVTSNKGIERQAVEFPKMSSKPINQA
ncbi:DMT family transporter [Microseira wollei]|uniref:Conserved hypothetical membrane protein n=1 Tax=Microseira wollei NIES-4236 TaxID=2530354 RepID=A0AAV3XJQ2_9CYAN|nr:DMT family transporter [Microseira wollei]GET42694.1 conserved hypothetical membrane protein [Microseira wollei NIES-4236]